MQSPEEREMSAETATALAAAVRAEAFPKAVVDVYVTVLEGDGGTTPACITAAALALADGGVPMNALVSACSLVRKPTIYRSTPTQPNANVLNHSMHCSFLDRYLLQDCSAWQLTRCCRERRCEWSRDRC